MVLGILTPDVATATSYWTSQLADNIGLLPMSEVVPKLRQCMLHYPLRHMVIRSPTESNCQARGASWLQPETWGRSRKFLNVMISRHEISETHSYREVFTEIQ